MKTARTCAFVAATAIAHVIAPRIPTSRIIVIVELLATELALHPQAGQMSHRHVPQIPPVPDTG
jgi:hypothetical protein